MGARLSAGAGRYDLGQNAEINVTPFVDVMLVLLIIFMVAAPLATATLKVELPTVSRTPSGTPRPPVFIDVGASGQVYLEGRPIAAGQLIAGLTAEIGGPKPTDERVMVRGDKGAAYGDVVTVMNLLQQAGFVHLGLVGKES